MDTETIRSDVAALMPALIDELAVLVGHASVAFPGHPAEPVDAMAAATVDLLRRYGFDNARLLEVPGGYPAVWADVPAPEGAPTVLLYAHYDVQPAPDDQGWESDPWTLTERDGRLYGRGAADDKSGIIIHAAAMKALGGDPGVGIKLCIEGEEEALSHLEEFVEDNPELFAADLYVVADMGNLVAGEPALTTTLRGDVACTVEVRTVEQALHSGVFGGPAPDALMALIKLLATLVDDRGNTVVPGLTSYEWPGAAFPEDLYREQAGMLPGVEIVGDGSVSSRLWSQPNVTVIGLDAPRTADASNILIPSALARLSMRIAPGEDADAALDRLAEHLERNAPWGVRVTVDKVKAAPAFEAPTGGRGMQAARAALREAYGSEPSEVGSGGSIPLLSSFAKASPGAEFVLWGAEDVARSKIHGGNESVDPAEIERAIVAQALLLAALAGR